MTKYSLTISDLSKSEVLEILDRQPDTFDNVKGVVINNAVQPVSAPQTPAQATMAAAVEANLLPQTAPPLPSHFTEDPTETVEEASDLDADGIVWDDRIHAGSKKQNKDGTWKKKRGVDEVLIQQITAELKGENVPAAPQTAPVTHAAFPEPDVPAAPTPPAPAASVPPPAPAATDALPPTRDFDGLMRKIHEDFTSGIVDNLYPNTIVDRINAGFKTDVPTIVDISGNAEMVDYAWQCVDVDVAARAA